MKSRDRRAERMSEFLTNMFQYNVTVGITRSEVFFFSDQIAKLHGNVEGCISCMPAGKAFVHVILRRQPG